MREWPRIAAQIRRNLQLEAALIELKTSNNMELTLVRDPSSLVSTIGRLAIDGIFECWTLEDVVRDGPKIPGKTAIPAGRYEVVVTFSQRFQRPLPLLLGVPHFTGVRIHPGNTDADTEGCILVGRTKGENFIGESRSAFSLLFLKLQQAVQREKVFIEITEKPHE